MDELEGLVEFRMKLEEIPRGLHLVAGLTGFADSGSAVSQTSDYVLDTMDSQVVAVFDPDALLDYRARRPTIYFDQDHLTGYEPPMLAIHMVRDELGRPFLFLTGYEPDFKWEAFSRVLIKLIDLLEVKLTTWVHAIPMPVPHTRPIGSTVSGTDREVIQQKSVWRPHTQVPSNAMHLVEYRLQESGHDVVGFVLLIPHYLADTEYPNAAVVALEQISSVTGLIFATDRLRDEGREFTAKIDAQIETNEELGKLVAALEERYDSYMRDNAVAGVVTDESNLPSADEIAAELEDFLAARRSAEDPGETFPQ